MHRLCRTAVRCGLALAVLALGLACGGCPRNQTTLDDRPLESRPLVETEAPTKRSDPFRP